MQRRGGMRLHITFGAVASIIAGIMFFCWADGLAQILARIVGFIILLIGGSQFLANLFGNGRRASGMLIGGLIAISGFWIIANPDMAVKIIPMVMGMVLVVYGVQVINLSFAGRTAQMARWKAVLGVGILDVVLGIICIFFAFQVGVLPFRIMGLMMIYNGITSAFVVHKVNRAEKDIIDSRIIRETMEE